MSDPVEFSLLNQDDKTVSSDDLADKSYVMSFYPQAMTPGCTVESCDFRDSYDGFAAAGYEIVGVSPDPPSRNATFKEKEELTFDLLSDEDHALPSGSVPGARRRTMGRCSRD